MKWLVFCGRVLLGLVLACVFFLVSSRLFMATSCWRWDPESGWKPPWGCGFLSGVLRTANWIALGSALLLPLYLLTKKDEH